MPNPIINRRIGGGNPFADDANAIIAAWVANCTSAGETPTDPVIAAVKTLYIDCRIGGVWPKMKMLNPCAPGTNFWDVTRTPLLAGNGSQSWAATGGGANAPMPNGLVAAGSPNVWETTINLSTLMTSINNAGITIYGYSIPLALATDLGVYDNSNNNSFHAFLNFTGNGSLGRIGLNANGTASAFPGNGYFSFNRTSSTDMRAFWANSMNPHAQLGATQAGSNAGASFINQAKCPVGGLWNTPANVYVNQASSNMWSFIALHDGLTESESSAFFTAIQKYRMAVNGGFI
jgi:hypothetical protein